MIDLTNHEHALNEIFALSDEIRYVALYIDDSLTYRQRDQTLSGASAGETDRFEELLVNPTLLKLATQRGNIDCGGLDHLVIGYGNFNQIVKEVDGGHVSICLQKTADLNELPRTIFSSILEA